MADKEIERSLALLRSYQRDAKDYALYAKRAKTERTKRYWLKYEATALKKARRIAFILEGWRNAMDRYKHGTIDIPKFAVVFRNRRFTEPVWHFHRGYEDITEATNAYDSLTSVGLDCCIITCVVDAELRVIYPGIV